MPAWEIMLATSSVSLRVPQYTIAGRESPSPSAYMQRRALARDRALALDADDVEREVGAVEAGAHRNPIAQVQPCGDLLGDSRRGGGGGGHHRGASAPVRTA